MKVTNTDISKDTVDYIVEIYSKMINDLLKANENLKKEIDIKNERIFFLRETIIEMDHLQ
tara:strand:+ start:1517 stop:1696 length:180 start_codon:yes stop_codon:yes gene_type:complete